eukprot:UN0750
MEAPLMPPRLGVLHDELRLDDELLVQEHPRALRLEVLVQVVDLLILLAQVVEGLGGDPVARPVDVPSDGVGRADGVVVRRPGGGPRVHHRPAEVGHLVPPVERV